MRTWKTFRWTGPEGVCLFVLVALAIWSMTLPSAEEDGPTSVATPRAGQRQTPRPSPEELVQRQKDADRAAARRWVQSLHERPTRASMEAEYKRILAENEAAAARVLDAIKRGEPSADAQQKLERSDKELIVHEYRMRALGCEAAEGDRGRALGLLASGVW